MAAAAAAGLGFTLSLATGCQRLAAQSSAASQRPAANPRSVGYRAERERFTGALWDDGKAEVASYRVLERRYGTMREGSATLIVVKEPFDPVALVKADGPTPPGGTIDVMKLNHVLTTPTGVYTYRQMASVFLTRRALLPLKLTTGSQEWCGLTHKRLIVRGGRILLDASSYFGAEGERSYTLNADRRTVFEDALPVWLRTLDFRRAGPRRLRLLSRQLSSHAPPPALQEATVTVGNAERIQVPAGVFEVVPVTLRRAEEDQRFLFDQAAPHPLVRWERPGGERYELIALHRAAYWNMNRREDVGALDPPARPGQRPSGEEGR